MLHSYLLSVNISFVIWFFLLAGKGDGSDVEAEISEEDFLMQDEICKSRLASIKRVHLFVLYLVVIAFTEVGICMQFEAVGNLIPYTTSSQILYWFHFNIGRRKLFSRKGSL